MAHYLIVKSNPDFAGGHLVWNFRKKIWTNQVTNGCRYTGVRRGRWSGITPPDSCDRQFAIFHAIPGRCDSQIFNEDYLLNGTGQAYKGGLTFA